jgi:hypothetical protein
MLKFSRDQEASFFFFGLGILLCFMSLQYGHGDFSNPGPGFINFWSSVMISFFSVIGFLASIHSEMKIGKESLLGPFWHRSFVILLALIGFAISMEFLGLLICCFLFMFILLRTIGSNSWKTVWTVSLGTTIALYLLFYVWLGIQIPMGILRTLIH